MRKEFLVGYTEDEILVVTIDTDRDCVSVTGDVYSRDFITEDEGESRAREYLEDGELWRMCVSDCGCTRGLYDFIEDVLNTDGWQHVVGDMYETGEIDGETYYASLTSCGQTIDVLKKVARYATMIDAKMSVELVGIWEVWHLAKLSLVPRSIIRMIEDFEALPDFDQYELIRYRRQPTD